MERKQQVGDCRVVLYSFHFLASKKMSQLKIKTQIGPFICNIMAVGEETDTLLKEMQFSLSFTWSYDPLGGISKLRVENKSLLISTQQDQR